MANADGSFKCFGKTIMPPQVSIHPRVVNGRTVHPKVNTCKGKATKEAKTDAAVS